MVPTYLVLSRIGHGYFEKSIEIITLLTRLAFYLSFFYPVDFVCTLCIGYR
jgi:hypothetical protein